MFDFSKAMRVEEYLALSPAAREERVTYDDPQHQQTSFNELALNAAGGVNECAKCGAIGVSFGDPSDLAKNRLTIVVDCGGTHPFKVGKTLDQCEVCDGRLVKFHLLGTKSHSARYYLRTNDAPKATEELVHYLKGRQVFWESMIWCHEQEIIHEAAKKTNAAWSPPQPLPENYGVYAREQEQKYIDSLK